MDSIRDRAKDKFPMVLLTLLSIVQALALEFLWDHARQRADLIDFSWIVVAGWMQIAATLNVIILIWLMYAGMLMRFRWTPTLSDSVLPFFIGLMQFLMIEIMGDGKFALWVIVLACTFGILHTVNHRAMKRARRDSANAEFFVKFSPATFRDFLPEIAQFLIMMAAGAWVAVHGEQPWLSMTVLVAIYIGLAYETRNAAIYWRASMGEDASPPLENKIEHH